MSEATTASKSALVTAIRTEVAVVITALVTLTLAVTGIVLLSSLRVANENDNWLIVAGVLMILYVAFHLVCVCGEQVTSTYRHLKASKR